MTPGDSPGILAVSGNYQQGSGGRLNIEVGGTTAGTQYDQLKVSGTATLAGTLDATLINGFGPGAGEQFAALTAGGGISGSFATINLPSIDGRPAFTVQTIAGPPPSVELFAAVEAPDLAAVGGSITVNGVSPASAAGTTGQSLTVGYTIANLSSDAATGTWTDSVYLSANGLLDADSLLLGRVSHAGGLAGMSSYNGTLTGVVPGAVDGGYPVIVVPDSGLQVPDLNRANNAGVSTSAVPVLTPTLALGGTVSGTIAAGQDLYYKVTVRPGQDVELDGALTAANEAAIFARRLSVPTPSAFDESGGDPATMQPSILLPGSQGGTYYILIQGQPGAGGGGSVHAPGSGRGAADRGLHFRTGRDLRAHQPRPVRRRFQRADHRAVARRGRKTLSARIGDGRDVEPARRHIRPDESSRRRVLRRRRAGQPGRHRAQSVR